MPMRAQDVMTPNPACCPADMTVDEVARLMRFNDCGEIPVIDGSDQIVGVITDRDIVTRIVAEGMNPAAHTAAQAMTEEVITVRRDALVEEVLATMEEHRIRRIPVVDERGSCVGIIAQADIAATRSHRDVAELVREVSRDDKRRE